VWLLHDLHSHFLISEHVIESIYACFTNVKVTVKYLGRLGRMDWRPTRWSVCLPLLIFPCTIKSRSSLLAPAHPGGPRKRANSCGGGGGW